MESSCRINIRMNRYHPRTSFLHPSFRSLPLVSPTGVGGSLLHRPPEGGLQGKHAPDMGREVRRCHARKMSSATDSSVGLGPRPLCRAADASESAQVRSIIVLFG